MSSGGGPIHVALVDDYDVVVIGVANMLEPYRDRVVVAELDTNKRFQAQTQARTAIDRLRREIHCASAISVGGGGSSVVVTLPAHCPTSGGSIATITYDTVLVSASRYRLRRASVILADYLATNSTLFSYTAPSASTLGQLHVDMSVNVNPNEGWKRWHLVTDIVLRNTVRS